jgi:hypothetical protein
MKKNLFLMTILSAVFLLCFSAACAQNPTCDDSVPEINVDFTGLNAGTVWYSQWLMRNGYCCGAIAPSRCIDFTVATDTGTVAVILNICTYIPNPGVMLYTVDCGDTTSIGDTVFIAVPGIHYFTFCKPGNASYIYCISSLTGGMLAITGTNEIQTSCSGNLNVSTDLTGNYFLNVCLPMPSSFDIAIFSIDGKMVYNRNYSFTNNEERKISLPIEYLKQGIYFCRAKGENLNKTVRFIKY